MASASPAVLNLLAGLVEEHAGLSYHSGDSDLLTTRLAARSLERGFDSLLDYYYFLRYDEGGAKELDALVEALVVGETYLFRELPPLEAVVSELVAPAVAAGRRPRIWCAACSTGEEPLTLAMLLDEAGLLDQVTLVASDISARALAQAQSGVYRRRSLRSLPSGVVGRWLEGDENGMRVAPHLVRAIAWHRVNLVDDRACSELGAFDIISCRNVLIYFRDRTIEQLVDRLWQQLTPEGLLLIGASESLLRFKVAFACEEQRGAFFYRKLPK